MATVSCILRVEELEAWKREKDNEEDRKMVDKRAQGRDYVGK